MAKSGTGRATILALGAAAALAAATPAEAKRGFRFSIGGSKPAPAAAAVPNGGRAQPAAMPARPAAPPSQAARPTSSGSGIVVVPIPRASQQPQPQQQQARPETGVQPFPAASPGIERAAAPATPVPTLGSAAAPAAPGGFAVVTTANGFTQGLARP